MSGIVVLDSQYSPPDGYGNNGLGYTLSGVVALDSQYSPPDGYGNNGLCYTLSGVVLALIVTRSAGPDSHHECWL